MTAFETRFGFESFSDHALVRERDRLRTEYLKVRTQLSALLMTALQAESSEHTDQAVDRVASVIGAESEQIWGILAGNEPVLIKIKDGSDPVPRPGYGALIQAIFGGPGYEEKMRAANVALDKMITLSRSTYFADEERRRRRNLENRERAKAPSNHRTARTAPAPEPVRVVEDVPGHECRPDPLTAATVPELVEMLRRLQVWAGAPSLRKLSRRSRGRVAHSTLSVMLKRSDQLPGYDTLREFVRALGCDDDYTQAWLTTWREFALDLRGTNQPSEENAGTVLRMTGS
jgi:hypothetical protein